MLLYEQSDMIISHHRSKMCFHVNTRMLVFEILDEPILYSGILDDIDVSLPDLPKISIYNHLFESTTILQKIIHVYC